LRMKKRCEDASLPASAPCEIPVSRVDFLSWSFGSACAAYNLDPAAGSVTVHSHGNHSTPENDGQPDNFLIAPGEASGRGGPPTIFRAVGL
jgi:hypothetical protein